MYLPEIMITLLFYCTIVITFCTFQTDCSTSEGVCGHNGETYPHECAALADRTTVDYYGECRLIGQYMGKWK